MEISREVYHKNRNKNTIGGAKVIVLLELLQVLERKGCHINQGIVKISFDNRVNHRKLVEDIIKVSIYIQDAGAEKAQIVRVIKKIKFKIDIQLIRGYLKQNELFQRKSLNYLIQKYDMKAKQV